MPRDTRTTLTPHLAARLAEILGAHAVSTKRSDLDFYSADALDRIRAFSAAPLLETMPDVVVSPQDTDQVAAVVRLANEEGVPIVPYGAGTGVMGAAVPIRGGIVLSLARMNRILSIDPGAMTATVQAGVILGNLDRELESRGLMLGHDPWSTPIASVGGAIATNGVGYRARTYGPMGKQVVALEVVLPTGAVLRTRPVSKVAGPSLKDLFPGAEGVFGVVTEATLRVFAQPEQREFRSFSFPTFEAGFSAAQELTRLGIRPALMDLSEEWGRRIDSGNAEAHEVSFTLVFEGYTEGVAAELDRTLKICAAHAGQDQGEHHARQHWDFRHQMAYRYQERLKSQGGRFRRERGWRQLMDYLHASLPASEVVGFYQWSKALIAERGLGLYEAAIWTDAELFSLLLGDPTEGDPGDAGRSDNLARTTDDILMKAQDLGGSMEYCHGVGVKLLHLLDREWGAGAEVVHGMKASLDPRRIMNPGKLGL